MLGVDTGGTRWYRWFCFGTQESLLRDIEPRFSNSDAVTMRLLLLVIVVLAALVVAGAAKVLLVIVVVVAVLVVAGAAKQSLLVLVVVTVLVVTGAAKDGGSGAVGEGESGHCDDFKCEDLFVWL